MIEIDLARELANRLSVQPQYLDVAVMAQLLRFALHGVAAEAMSATAVDQLIMLLDLQGERGALAAQQARANWWTLIGAPLWAQRTPVTVSNLDPHRPLRVGYVSGDYKLHSCALIFGPIVFGHSQEFQAILYSSTPESVRDTQTKHFEKHPGFHDVSALDDEQLAQRIRDDAIDILVDLSGYTPYNRLPVFARKPAALQISAWGYSIGLGWPRAVIDAMIADPIVASPEIRAQLTEEVLDLPCLVGQCVPLVPELAPLPCLTKPPTFGAFHQTRKLTPQCLALWDRILAALPESTLIFKGAGYTDDVIAWIRRCMPYGAERLSFWGATSYLEHLAAYQSIDLTLDPFPQTGCVTCVEGLMMGVPSVTLIGPTMIQRACASIMTAVGFGFLVASTEPDYVATACDLVTFKKDLERWRAILRHRVISGPLYLGYQAAYESALRGLWQRYCARMKSDLEPATAVLS